MAEEVNTTPFLGPIHCVTFSAPDLAAVEDAYTRYLDYRVVQRGPLEPALADAWGCRAQASSPSLLLAPAAADDCFFRVVESPAVPQFVPFGSFGWNAAELMVRNVDAMAERLADSPFLIVGEPQDLSFCEDIRAMQILGPGKELLYLTEFKRPVPGLDVPTARCDVDRTFIVILGGPSLPDLQEFFTGEFEVSKQPAVESRVKGMSAAFDLDPEHRYPIAALPLAGQSLIEVDEMPPQAQMRPRHSSEHLPPGISVVSFGGQAALGKSAVGGGPLYADKSSATSLIGAAGEIIEVLEPCA